MLLNVGYTEAIKVADWDCLGKFISTADLKSFHMAWTQVFPLSLNNFLNSKLHSQIQVLPLGMIAYQLQRLSSKTTPPYCSL